MTGLEFLHADWRAPDSVVAGTTLCRGGFSTGPYASFNLGRHVGDDPDAVASNRRLLRDMLELSGEPAWLRQVHGTRVVDAASVTTGTEADASWAAEAGVACVVMTADCLPVLFSRRDGSRIAAAHAGWRGLADGVLEATVEAIATRPDELVAWLGPAISMDAFEVGDEVRERFVAADSEAAANFRRNRRGRWQADLYGLARRRLAAAGVTEVSGGASCTFGDADRFFSFRRDRVCGRMASLIFRRNEA